MKNPVCVFQGPKVSPIKIGLVIIGHGSRDPDALAEFLSLIQMIDAAGQAIIESGYLEFGSPTIQEAIDCAVTRGATALVVLPAMLTSGRHLTVHIPAHIETARQRHPTISIADGSPLYFHPKIVSLCKDRTNQAIQAMGQIDCSQILLLVIGQGTSDPHANGDLQKMTRILWEGTGVGWAIGCYAGVTAPLLPEALEHALRLPYRHLVIFPYFLFTGVLVKRIQATALLFQEANPDRLVKVASHLGPDPAVRDIFLECFSKIPHAPLFQSGDDEIKSPPSQGGAWEVKK